MDEPMTPTASWSPIDWANRGGELLATHPRLAQRLLNRAICGLPTEAVAYYNLGIGLHQQRRIPAAIRAYRTSLALPGAPMIEATNNLSQDLLLQGCWAEGWEL
jgi:Flp pilus assembly protein TadD